MHILQEFEPIKSSFTITPGSMVAAIPQCLNPLKTIPQPQGGYNEIKRKIYERIKDELSINVT
jgi:hypothetical protein